MNQMAPASGTLLRRQACLIVLLAGGLLAGPFTPSVGAQPRDRVELQIGGGYVLPVELVQQYDVARMMSALRSG